MRHHPPAPAALLLVIGVALAGPSSVAGAEQSLEAARELYVAARYDDALALLDGLRAGRSESVRELLPSIEQYRSLCLLALGRTEEAETAIARAIAHDPLFRPDEGEVSPRLRAAFQDVRRRVLPEIAAREFAEARALYDRADYEAAAAAFVRVERLAADPDADGRLDDLTLLAAGFSELARAALAPPPEPEPEPAPPPMPDPRRVYDADEPGISEPETLRQPVPRLPPAIASQIRGTGMLELVIDARGGVESAVLRLGLHPAYDRLLLDAARTWQFRPAMLYGQPVKFRKMVRIETGDR